LALLIKGKKHTLFQIHIRLHVSPADSGKTVFDHSGSKLFIPASNLKIITSAGGSLERVSTMSGYVTGLDGERLAFSIMTNGFTG